MADFKRQFTGGEVGRSPDGSTASAVWTAHGFSSGDAALNDPSCPVKVNDRWLDDLSSPLRADRVRAATISPRLYRITASYSVPSGGGEHNDDNENPLSSAVEFRWDPVVMSLPVEADSEGNPIISSSTRGFESQVYVDFEAQQLTVTRNEPTYSIQTALQFTNRVNAGTYGGAKEGLVRCTNIMPVSSFTASDSYVKVAYRFLFMSDEVFGSNPHQPRILDQDTMTRALVSTGGSSGPGEVSLVRITTSAGDPVDGPVLLNGLGQPLDDTLTFVLHGKVQESPIWGTNSPPPGSEIETTAAGAVFLRYNSTYPSADFGQLGLPV